jgi:GT2 family glycosyltransferase
MSLVHAQSAAQATQALVDARSPVVVIPVHNGFEDVVRCYESVFAHTPATHAILVVDDGGDDRSTIDILERIADRINHLVVVLHRSENGGFVKACNDAFVVTAGRDVVLLNSDCVVGPQWLERLTDAASSSSLIATVTALTNHGTIVSVPVRNTSNDRLPGGMDVDTAALRVASSSLKLRPTLPTAVGHCTLIRRLALDLVGGFDEAFGTGYGEEVDFSQRALRLGLRHVCADDVLVYHRGGASFGPGATVQQQANEAIVNARYPWYPNAVLRASTDEYSPLALALDRARMALLGRTIGVDALSLGPHTAGTQMVTFETICALADRLDGDELVVFHRSFLPPDLAAAIDDLDRTRRVMITELTPMGEPMVDVVYRPCQINSPDELGWLRSVGRRTIVNQFDVMGWSNPSGFASDHEWLQRRELTRLVLSCVDGVAHLRQTSAREAGVEGLVPVSTPQRVVWCGTDHRRPPEFTWERTATELLALADEVLSRPPNRVDTIRGQVIIGGQVSTGGHDGSPSGFRAPMAGSSDRRAGMGRGFEWLVDSVGGSAGLKRVVSPDDSRRQGALRRFINWARRRTGVHVKA